MKKRLKIAIIGSGISGLGCSWLLSKRFDVDLYEKSDYIGGHSNTQTIKTRFDNRLVKVDTGFIVFNELTLRQIARSGNGRQSLEKITQDFMCGFCTILYFWIILWLKTGSNVSH